MAHSGWLAERSTFVDVKSARPSGGLLTRRVRSPRRRKWVYRVLEPTQGRRTQRGRGALTLPPDFDRPAKDPTTSNDFYQGRIRLRNRIEPM